MGKLLKKLSKEKVKLERPGVFYVDKVTGEVSERATFGTDVFINAGLTKKTGNPLVYLAQDQYKNVIVKTEGNPDEKGLPAGSSTIQNDYEGAIVRLAVLKIVPYLRKKRLNDVRVASVVLPIIKFLGSGKEYLLITQRVHLKKGSYNDLWVFPGGHVEFGETLEEGGAREAREETGLEISPYSLKPLCCWQEFMVNQKTQVQFLISMFSATIEVEDGIDETSFLTGLGLQEKEVHCAALMPKSTWKLLSERSSRHNVTMHHSHGKNDILWDSDFDLDKVPGVLVDKSGLKPTEVKVDSVYGHGHTTRPQGIGAPHRFAVRELIKEIGSGNPL